MGYSMEKFVTKPNPNLICGICACVLRDAVLTRCGHAFCQACLDTWLARPLAGTCPQCRTCISKFQVSPVWAIREIINGLSIYCSNADRGCSLTLGVENLEKHLDSCGYAPVECVACGVVVNRLDYPAHTVDCEKYTMEKSGQQISTQTSTAPDAPDIEKLNQRLNALEIQLKHSRKQLHLCQADNRKLERELSKTRIDLQRKRTEFNSFKAQMCEFDPDYSYGFHPDGISKLSLLIACHQLEKPDNIDQNRIFNCIQRCYDNFARCGSRFEHDVHMLIATAYASKWFSDNQKINFHCWLQSIARYRKYADWGRTAVSQQGLHQHHQDDGNLMRGQVHRGTVNIGSNQLSR
ncbi:E3 ubiquitin-protein ligase PDZRN3-like [Lytechinus pictus]|uniref:E3 ubiquitin-protein ligase PDZRN3-like n=1 Tax=Lytechinus pictus TaxID=7653 RepID=UPI0030B9DEC6